MEYSLLQFLNVHLLIKRIRMKHATANNTITICCYIGYHRKEIGMIIQRIKILYVN